jgi:hypothetical protein
MALPLIPLVMGGFSWLKNSTVGRYAIMAGGLLLTVFFIFNQGKAAQRKKQKLDDLEFGADIRRRTDEAEERHDADMAQLPDDPDERKRAIIERLRAKGGIRD